MLYASDLGMRLNHEGDAFELCMGVRGRQLEQCGEYRRRLPKRLAMA